MTTISNEWITLQGTYKGIQVQRKFAGFKTDISENDEVDNCTIFLWQRELYPDGSVSKMYKKFYTLQDLAKQDVGLTQFMDELKVLQMYINAVGSPYIINPVRDRLADLVRLPFDFEDGYPLHRDTREVKDKNNN